MYIIALYPYGLLYTIVNYSSGMGPKLEGVRISSRHVDKPQTWGP